jgi:hypothetical protein
MASRQVGRPKVNFEEYKDTLYRLYVTEHQQMEEVRQYMKTFHNFDARQALLLY